MISTIAKIILIGTVTGTSLCFAEEIHFSLEQTNNTPENVTSTPVVPAQENKDPFEKLNRKIYAFNDSIDSAVLRPVAVQYAQKIPEPVRGSYGNFRSNLREPWNATNQLLQGKFGSALTSLGRFTINTITSLGFADTAKYLKLAQEKDDFGTTLGVWGVPSGPYVVLPFLGPSTVRDSVGTVADTFARPQSHIFEHKVYWANNAVEILDARAAYLGVDSILQGDKYAALRNVYLQQRAFQIANKRGEADENLFAEDPFGEEEFEEDLDEEIDTNESEESSE